MSIRIQDKEQSWSIDLNRFHDISISIRKSGNVNCYFLDDPQFSYFSSPAFSGSLDAGGSVNCEKISFYPHASGTHTECALHVLKVDFDMRQVMIPALQLCRLITLQPEQIGPDRVISMNCFRNFSNPEKTEAIVVRCLPNDIEKLSFNYSDTNPTHFDPEVLSFLSELGFKHLVTDLPSIDKESDEGRLSAHKNWFAPGAVASPDRTITELVYIPSDVEDGLYALSIQAPSMETDAVPSRVLLYPLQ